MISWILGGLLLGAGQAAQAAPPRDALWLPDAETTWQAIDQAPLATEPWWRTFGDAGLAALLDEVLRANRDLAGGWARVLQSRAQARATMAPLLPTLNATASGTLAPSNSLGFQFGGLPTVPGQPEAPATYQTGQAVLAANWELDVFFRQGSQLMASRHDARAAMGDMNAQRLALTTASAEAWFDAIAARERLRVLDEQLGATATLLELVELRFAGAEASSVDVLQQRQQLSGLLAQRPTALALIAQTDRRLAVLAGHAPDPSRLPERPNTLPLVADATPGAPPPSALVDARPELGAAIARVDAASWRKRAAARAMLPRLSVNAQAGLQAFNLTEFRSQDYWGAGASVSVPLFQGGALQAQHTAARHAELSAVHAASALALQAVAEIDSAADADRAARERLTAIEAQRDAAERAYADGRERYLQGLSTYVQLLTAQSSWLQAELGAIDARRGALSSRIQLFDAIGGDWFAESDPAQWSASQP